MHRFIRLFAIISFIFVSFIFSACGVSTAEKYSKGNANRPLIKPNVTSDKPKIVAFGDSLTAGFGLSEKDSYPYLLQKRLEADGFEYEVINAGVSAETSVGGLERIDWVLGLDNVEILVLELGANDLLRGLPVVRMKENLSTMIKKAKAKNVKVLLCGMLAPDTMGADYQREYVTAFPDLASEHTVAFLPFILESVALKKELNQADGIHPNADGAKIMTDNVYKSLKPMLRK